MPSASFTYVKTGRTVVFTDTSTYLTDPIVAWYWDFGNGRSSTIQNPTHVYDSDGTYDVRLIVMDDMGITDITTETIVIFEAPELPRVTVRSLWRWLTWRLNREFPSIADLHCIYTVRDPSIRDNQLDRWPVKTTDQSVLFTIDWTFYAENNPIVLSTWEVDKSCRILKEIAGDTTTQMQVTGGKDRATYSLRNTVTLYFGEVYTEVVKFKNDDKGC